MSDSYIFRRTRSEKYTIVPNALIKDTRLSWEARGLLIYLLSKKSDWTVRKTDLERKSQANDFVVSRILKELEECRYIFREQKQQETGQFEWITYVFDEPIPESPKHGKPPDIVSTKLKSTKTGATKKDVIDAMMFYSKKGNGLEDYPADVIDYLSEFVVVFKREPSPQEKSGWIKEARKWRDIGVCPEDIKPMFKYCKDEGLAVKSPFSITFAYDVIRTEEQTHYRKGK